MKNRPFVTLLLGGFVFVTATSASAAVLRVSCDDYSNSGASMWARYIDSGERKTLDVVLKIPVTDKNLAKPDRSVLIGVDNVGQITLEPNDEGMMSGSLSFNSYAGNGETTTGVAPFPGTWTGAVSGSVVRTAGLSCELRD